jgi:hypothetical protein
MKTNGEEAKKRLQEAAETFTKLGARLDLQRAEDRLSTLQS